MTLNRFRTYTLCFVDLKKKKKKKKKTTPLDHSKVLQTSIATFMGLLFAFTVLMLMFFVRLISPF